MKKVRRLICKIFGHMWSKEEPYYDNWKMHQRNYCPMCGKTHRIDKWFPE